MTSLGVVFGTLIDSSLSRTGFGSGMTGADDSGAGDFGTDLKIGAGALESL